MLKSMTAYGRAVYDSSIGRIVVELHSVNRKHLEINNYLPKELLRYDADIKKWISAEVGRGQVNVKISVVLENSSPVTVSPNLALAASIKNAWTKLASHLGIAIDNQGWAQIFTSESGLLIYDETIQDEELYRRALREAVGLALTQFLEMKLTEGRALYQDIIARFSKLPQWIHLIEEKAPDAVQRYRERLKKNIEELMGADLETEERLLREVCIYAERVDIAEEITRFKSHLLQAENLLNSQNQAVGKTLEFIVQELNREINTIGSKSADVEISRVVVEVKSELERIREQLQNIE